MKYKISDCARRDPCFQGDRTPKEGLEYENYDEDYKPSLEGPSDQQIKTYRLIESKKKIRSIRKRLARNQNPDKTYYLVRKLTFHMQRMRSMKDEIKICQVIEGLRDYTSNVRTCKPKNKMNNGGV